MPLKKFLLNTPPTPSGTPITQEEFVASKYKLSPYIEDSYDGGDEGFFPPTGIGKNGLHPRGQDEHYKTEMDIRKTTLKQIIKNYAKIDLSKYPNIDELFNSFKPYLEGAELKEFYKLPKITKSGNELIGIEIELENAAGGVFPEFLKIPFNSVWATKHDTSLRNNGVEFVSHVGLQAKFAPQALFILKKLLSLGKAETNYRTGTHIHISVRDLTVEHFINLCLLYVLFENTFYKLSGNRWKNNFCVPIRASNSYIEQLLLLTLKKNPTYADFKNIFSNFKKYMAFNVLPVARNSETGKPFGTIEFRHHKGESNPKILLPWIGMITDVHHAAQQYTYPDLKEKIYSLNTSSQYLEFAEEIFSSPPVTSKHTFSDISADMREGSAYIKELHIMAEEQ